MSDDELHGIIQAPDLIWRALRKHWLLVVGVAAVVVVAATFHTLGQKKIYRATATVQIDPSPPRPLGSDVHAVVDMGSGTYWNNREYYATQYKIIRGREVARATVLALGLHKDSRFIANVSIRDPAPPLPEVAVDDVAAMLVGRLKVEPVKESRLAEISLDDADPHRARVILAKLLDLYRERNVEVVVASTDAATVWLNAQLIKLRGELERSEMDLHAFKKDKRLLSVSLDDQSNMLREEMRQLNQALTTVRTRREGLLARVREIEKVNLGNPAELPASELLASPVLSSVRQEYVRARSDVASLVGSGRGENHPEVQAAQQRVSTTRAAVLAEVENIKGALKSDLDSTTREAEGLTRIFGQAKQRAMDLNLQEIEYRRLERTKENTEKLYGLVLENSKESELSGLMRFNNVRIAEEPLVLPVPVRPRIPLNVALATLGGLALGFIVATGREVLDRRIRSPEEVESELGVTFLGLLPLVSGLTRGRLDALRRRRGSARGDGVPGTGPPELTAHAVPASGLAEAARSIRTNLVFASPDEPIRRLLVTSASPQDGKTLVSSTIAIVMAQAGQRVVLVDCDLRRGRLHRVFGKVNDTGVTSAVLDYDVLDGRTFETDVPNLSVLPSGVRVANPAELLQSESFGRLLDELARRYDRVVLDSPPIAGVTDAVILSKRVDAAVFVARAFGTSRDMAKYALRALQDVGARVAGCVLNGVDFSRNRYGYRYYYQYYSRYYTQSPSHAAQPSEAAPSN